VVAFLAGRSYPTLGTKPAQLAKATDQHAGEGVLMVAVGDYLERSQMVLLELTECQPERASLDISSSRNARGHDQRRPFVSPDRRSYGDSARAGVLEDLNSVLMEIDAALFSFFLFPFPHPLPCQWVGVFFWGGMGV